METTLVETPLLTGLAGGPPWQSAARLVRIQVEPQLVMVRVIRGCFNWEDCFDTLHWESSQQP